jgi:hypothetical protein
MMMFRSISRTGAVWIGVLLVGASSVGAQVPGAASVSGVNAAFVELMSSVKAFTAQADARVVDARQSEELEMPMRFAQLDGKIRIEIDVAQIKSQNLPPQQIKEMKEAGLNHIISIIRPDKKFSYVLYPAIQSYSVVPMPKQEAEMFGKNLKLEKTALGKETLDGHPCVKNRVRVKDQQNLLLEATTWNASDLKDFPIRIERKDQGKTSTIQFHQVQFDRPDAKLFEPPPDYKRAE